MGTRDEQGSKGPSISAPLAERRPAKHSDKEHQLLGPGFPGAIFWTPAHVKLATALVPQAELLASAPRIRSQGWLAMEESRCMWGVLSFGTFRLQAALVNRPVPIPPANMSWLVGWPSAAQPLGVQIDV